jgi:adenylate cyclase
MTATRRLAAILAADVAGYSRLIGADEAGTLQAFNAIKAELFEPMVPAHNGRLVKTTGDGFLAEFSSVVDALRCATEIQAQLAQRNATVPFDKRLEFRLGINVGDILVENGDIFGDGVNVAVRLEGLSEPGGICVSSRVQEDAAGKLDLDFEDIGEQKLKNILRPVRAYRIRLGDARLGSRVARLTLPDKPSVAVLPFTNMSGDSEQEYFADGMSEDIITALSRCPWLLVVARNSSFTYRSRAVDLKQVGQELGARYVLEGGVRRAGARIRVTAQLVEAETGNHIWAHRYDRDLADIFAVQDEISESVTIAVAPAVADAELRRAMRTPPERLDAWSAYQRGLWHFFKFRPEDNALAQEFFQQAIELDPTFAAAYTGLAWAQSQAAGTFHTHNVAKARCSAEALARRAVTLDPAYAEAHTTLGLVLWLRGDHEGAVSEARHALAISPNLAFAHALLGATFVFTGQPREGIALIQTAIRLDPHDPMRPSRLNHIALGFYFCREYETAIDVAKQAIRSNPDYPLPYLSFLEAQASWLTGGEQVRTYRLTSLAAAPSRSSPRKPVSCVGIARSCERDSKFESASLQRRVCLCSAFEGSTQKGRRFRTACACVET